MMMLHKCPLVTCMYSLYEAWDMKVNIEYHTRKVHWS